ncbi:DUF2922 domain-containing protein [Alkaliphilus oremlandii]|uniref:DUF2922 domain-containing protein n=1 Tax=Alkaliphilus oremlandii (strain OhILAs) TaxID=350688 RepID=A8MJS7_ALKOO|nr:DUF2922 domain-containing protein [Alkaliphilus oremlandii]ABW20059.1 conserved hypothetical protein [Alkaliphilus oremlandii OhILAs]
MRVLELNFIKEDGKAAKITIANARENLTPAEVKVVMEHIISKDVFAPSGKGLVEAGGAKVITTQEEKLAFA